MSIDRIRFDEMMRAVISLGLIFAVLLSIAESTERIVAQVDHAALETKESIYRLQWGGARLVKEELETKPNPKHSFVCIGENKIEGPFQAWPTCFFAILNQKLLTQSELADLLPKLESETSWKKLGFASVGPNHSLEAETLTVSLDHDSSLQLLNDFDYQTPPENPPMQWFQKDPVECLKKYRKTRTRGGSSMLAHHRWRCSVRLESKVD